MIWERVFLENGTVRPIWRFFLSTVLIFFAILAVGVVLGLAFDILGYHPTKILALCYSSLLLFPVLLGLFKLLTASFEKKPLGSVGLAFLSGSKTELGLGLILGAAMILAVGGVEALFGLVEFSWRGGAVERTLARGLFFFVVLFVAAANEEMMFRGYPFQRLVEAVGPARAVFWTSVLFGFVHMLNPSVTWVAALNTMLVGVPFAVAYLRTRMLWLPIGMHFAWNFVQGFVLGLPVSGIVMPESLLRAELRGAAWVTGGAYGPEGGLLATATIFAVAAYVFLSRSIYIKEDTKKLVFGIRPSPPEAGGGTSFSITSAD
ncbi:MAG: CPBP family intramembrane metalloprotease [Acidobacteria bacterium]|nr:CPBP family intramembrane metalloprotease [Acidobacteriota bacterium]